MKTCTKLALVCLFLLGSTATAQDPAVDFQKIHQQWVGLNKQLDELDGKLRAAPEGEREALRAQYIKTVGQARQFMPQLQQAADAAYRAAPNKNPDVTQVLLGLASDALRRDDYDTALQVTQLLLVNKCPDPGLYNLAGIAAYGTDNFDVAEQLLQQAEKGKVLGELGARYLQDLPTAKERFQRETALRKQEAQANDLPRVRMETTKGAIVIELYENEAPETVGNFINLVEKKFYDEKTFHRVLRNFMAQGGCPEGSGRGGPGYKIYCECEAPQHRDHFRGTLSMAHAGKNTGGSQFFITFLRTPNLDARHTVFGRVIEGLDVLAKLQRRDPQVGGVEPDRLVKVEVLRKRNHEYVPNVVK